MAKGKKSVVASEMTNCVAVEKDPNNKLTVRDALGQLTKQISELDSTIAQLLESIDPVMFPCCEIIEDSDEFTGVTCQISKQVDDMRMKVETMVRVVDRAVQHVGV